MGNMNKWEIVKQIADDHNEIKDLANKIRDVYQYLNYFNCVPTQISKVEHYNYLIRQKRNSLETLYRYLGELHYQEITDNAKETPAA